MKPATRRRAWPTPTRSCAASSTASSTSTTSRPTCCRPHDGDLDWIARSLGLGGEAGACAAARPARRRARVRRDRVRRAAARRPRVAAARSRLPQACGPAPLPVDSEEFLEQLPPELARARSRRCCEQPKIRLLRDDSKVRLAPPGHARGARGQRRRAARWRPRCCFVDWIEPLLRRESYLALLVERPEVQNRLLRLLGLARWPMRYLMLHPGVIDELADERLLHEPLRRRGLQARARGAPRRRGSARARPTRSCCSTRCAAPITPRSSARWCATSRATSRSSRSPTTCRRSPTRRSAARIDWAWKHLKQRASRPSRSSRSSPTASSAARSSATAATSTSSSSTTMPTSRAPTRRPRSTAPSCAS